MTESTDTPKFYSTTQVAAMFDVKVATIRDWIRDGKLKGVKFAGGRWRVSHQELQRFANESLEK